MVILFDMQTAMAYTSKSISAVFFVESFSLRRISTVRGSI